MCSVTYQSGHRRDTRESPLTVAICFSFVSQDGLTERECSSARRSLLVAWGIVFSNQLRLPKVASLLLRDDFGEGISWTVAVHTVCCVGNVFGHPALEVVRLADVDHLLLGVHDAIDASHSVPLAIKVELLAVECHRRISDVEGCGES